MGESKNNIDGPKDLKFALLLATGSTVESAAAAVGYSYRAGRRRMENARFRELVKETRNGILQQAHGKLTQLAGEAADELQKAIRDPDPKVKLKAIELVFTARSSISHEFDFEQRLTALETRVKT